MGLSRQILRIVFPDLSQRPSKMRFYRLFGRDIPALTRDREIAADMASADFKLAKYFETIHYIGIDIDRTALVTGLGQPPETSTMSAVVADIHNPVFVDESVDIIASTHTIYRFEIEEIRHFLAHCLKALRSGGHLVFNLPSTQFNEDMEAMLRKNFSSVNVVSYRNSLSTRFESAMQDKQGFIQYPVDKQSPLRHVIYIATIVLAFLELFPIPGKDSRLYIRCTDRNDRLT